MDERVLQQSLQPSAGEEEHRPRGVGLRGAWKYAAIAATFALVDVVLSMLS